jgi:hypothetical protein
MHRRLESSMARLSTRRIRFAFLLLLASACAAAAPARVAIPLRAGLTVVSAVSRPAGDEEHLSVVEAVDARQVATRVEFRSAGPKGVAVADRIRRVRRADLADSARLNVVFQPGDAEAFPGATLMHVSAATLAALKRDGQAPMALGTLADAGTTADWQLAPGGRKYFRGTLKRLPGPPVMSVLVNGKPTPLPVVRAGGTLAVAGDQVAVEVWVLDDPANPLLLLTRQDRSRSQVVRIHWPGPQPQAEVLEQALGAGGCRIALEGLYFPTGSAQLLPRSRPALAAAAQLLQRHPDWRLSIEGHTDDVGGAAYNLDLSRRRRARCAGRTGPHRPNAPDRQRVWPCQTGRIQRHPRRPRGEPPRGTRPPMPLNHFAEEAS